MRHQKRKITLGRTAAPRRALMRALVESLILHGSVKTTLAKAKALRTIVEPIITRAKADTVANRRLALKMLYTEKALQKLFKDLGPRFATRPGGYTRITKLAVRPHDAAPTAKIEFV
jgi:large subunit ribosomal protein L17